VQQCSWPPVGHSLSGRKCREKPVVGLLREGWLLIVLTASVLSLSPIKNFTEENGKEEG